MLENAFFIRELRAGSRKAWSPLGWFVLVSALSPLLVLWLALRVPIDGVNVWADAVIRGMLLTALVGLHAALCALVGWRLGTAVFGAEQQQRTLETLRLVSASPWLWVPQKLLFPLYGLGLVWLAALPGYLAVAMRGLALPSTLWTGLLLAGSAGLITLAAGLAVPPERVGLPRLAERQLPLAQRLEMQALRAVPLWLGWQLLHLGYTWVIAAGMERPVQFRQHYLFRQFVLGADQLYWHLLGLFLLCGLTCALAWGNPANPAAGRLRGFAQLVTIMVGYLVVVSITWVGSFWFWQALLVAVPAFQLLRLAIDRRKAARVRHAAGRRDDPRALGEIERIQNQWDNPVLVRDLRVALRAGGLGSLFWRQWLVIGAITGAFSAMMLFGPWGSGVFPYFLKTLAGFMVGVLGWGAFVMLLRTSARASAQWNAERRMRTLPQLLLSPLESRRIVTGRWTAALLQGAVTTAPWAIGELVCLVVLMEGQRLEGPLVTCAWLLSMGILLSLALSASVRELSSWREWWSVSGGAIGALLLQLVLMVWGMSQDSANEATYVMLCGLFIVANGAALPVVLSLGSLQLERQRQRLFE